MLEQAVLTILTTSAVIFKDNLTFSFGLRRKIFDGDWF